jgi:hypothetical protein
MRYIILYIFSFFFSELFGQQYNFVKVLSGQGVVYNNDTILLYKTTVKELHQKLKIKDTLKSNDFILPAMWDGFNIETGEAVSGSEYNREIKFKSIIFEFADKTDKNNLKLRRITIRENEAHKIYTDNGLMIGMINPNLKEIFPIFKKPDYISPNGLTYCLFTYGISFQLEKIENGDLRIIEISTH